MLTDLHVHLRPDDLDRTAAEHFTAENAERYVETARERGVGYLGVSEHIYRFEQGLRIWDHPFWRENGHDDLDRYCDFVRDETELRLGIEADFVPGREDRTANVIEDYEFDYVLGSVHFLGSETVDMRGEWDVWGSRPDPDSVWRRYFETLGEAARSGLFDVLSHPDLVKLWGDGAPRPDRDLRHFYDLAMDGIADSDVAIEVSTAGLRKPVREIYPAPAFLEMCVEAGKPIALSSDAHVADDLAYGYDHATELLESLGVDRIATFDHRRRTLEPLG